MTATTPAVVGAPQDRPAAAQGDSDSAQRAQGSGALPMLRVLREAAAAWRALPRPAAVALVAVVVQQAFTIGFAFSLKLVVEDITDHRPSTDLALLLGILAAGFVIASVAAVVGERAIATGAASIVNGVRRRLYGHLLRLSPAYFLSTTPGKIQNSFSNNLRSLEGGVVAGFLDTATLLIGTAIAVPLLISLDWRLAVVTCCMLPAVIVVARRFLPRSVAANDAQSASELALNNTVLDMVRAQDVVRTFHLETVLEDRYERQLGTHRQRVVTARSTAATVGKGASLGVLLAQVCVVVLGAELAVHRVVSVGTLVGFITVLGLLAKNVYDFCRVDLALLAEAGRGARGINDLLAAPVVVTDPPDGARLPRAEGAISFDDVTFAYPRGTVALAGVSFDITPNSTVAVVGANGAGKSTLLRLLMRFYDPQGGSISIDGHDLRDVTQRSLREQLAVVLQGNFIFNDTIRENIRIGDPDADDADVETAARRAGLHEFVRSLPGGYDTLVGDGGGQLSGGQAQRLAIARALIRRPRFLLLDEVTTALDPATEVSVNAMLRDASAGRTMVTATHRLAAARAADLILVLEQGRLVERGTHDELLASAGVYRALWDKQSGFDISSDGRSASVDAARLRHIALFADLDDETLGRIALALATEYYEAGQTVFRQGDAGDRFYLLARGKVAVATIAPDGSEQLLNSLSDGDHFGEIALLQDRPRTATIRTILPCVFLTMGRDDFLKLVATTPEMDRMLEARLVQSELSLDEWRRLVSRARG